MSSSDPIDLLFGGLEKLGPGDNTETVHVLRLLPTRQFTNVVDAGCGTGRQTLVLAKELATPVHAVDSHQPFLNELTRRADEKNLSHLVHSHCMDMQDIPYDFHDIDLLWSEGAAYNIGFANALATWAPSLRSDGLVVVSELCWLESEAPELVRDYFQTGYPDMKSVQDNADSAEGAGYKLIATHTLPRESWVDGYYDILELRAQNLLNHSSAEVRAFAAETIREIEIFERSENSYGYVFFVLQRG